MQVPVNEIIEGNVLDVLKELPDAAVNCIITSPPYWGLRAYKTKPVIWGGQKDCRHKWGDELIRQDRGTPQGKTAQTGTHKKGVQGTQTIQGQFCSKKCDACKGRGYFADGTVGGEEIRSGCKICKGTGKLCSAWRGELGLEPTPELYIEHLMMVFDECKRVLRPDGICFVNLGDTYAGSGQGGGGCFEKMCQSYRRDRELIPKSDYRVPGVLAKSLCAIPERFVLAMMDKGWIRRCTIIWAKGLSFCETYSGSCMPDSAKDRPNHNGFEFVYMFTKSKKYWYEQQYEEAQELNAERPRMGQGNQTKYNSKRGYGGGGTSFIGHSGTIDAEGKQIGNPLGRTIRNVWTINPQAFSEAHFATFPEKLVEPLIKMGCPEFVCKKCGEPRSKIYKNIGEKRDIEWHPEKYGDNDKAGKRLGRMQPQKSVYNMSIEIGLTDCGCGEKFRPGIVLDPFAGSCTTALVAYKLRRDYIMIELQPDYIKIAEKRLTEAREHYGLFEK